MIAGIDREQNLHKDAARLLEGIEITVSKWGRDRRIRESVFTLGIRSLVWDPVNKLFNKSHMSLWEETQARIKNSGGREVVVAIGRRPIEESPIMIFRNPRECLRLDPGKNGVRASVHTLHGIRGMSNDDRPPTERELYIYERTLLAVKVASLLYGPEA
ncbi:hypothetical protein HYS95_02050 [Candidatus Daviesbacteria bacterium]|nr:hypothetical protein [Candidatus Daviesbacteria bacterium]